MNVHENEEVKFEMEITQKFRDALSQQANKAVRIFSRPDKELLNSKSEFNHPQLARVVVEKKNNQYTRQWLRSMRFFLFGTEL